MISFGGVVVVVSMELNTNLKNRKNISLIIKVLKKEKKMRRADLYKEVMKEQLKKYWKVTTYQVICRDVCTLIDNEYINVVEGGKRSQVVELTGKAYQI